MHNGNAWLLRPWFITRATPCVRAVGPYSHMGIYHRDASCAACSSGAVVLMQACLSVTDVGCSTCQSAACCVGYSDCCPCSMPSRLHGTPSEGGAHAQGELEEGRQILQRVEQHNASLNALLQRGKGLMSELHSAVYPLPVPAGDNQPDRFHCRRCHQFECCLPASHSHHATHLSALWHAADDMPKLPASAHDRRFAEERQL